MPVVASTRYYMQKCRIISTIHASLWPQFPGQKCGITEWTAWYGNWNPYQWSI